MQDLVCPHCNKAFKIDETGYTDLVAQVRNNEFSKAVNERLSQAEKDKNVEIKLKEKESENSLQALKRENEIEIERLKMEINQVTN